MPICTFPREALAGKALIAFLEQNQLLNPRNQVRVLDHELVEKLPGCIAFFSRLLAELLEPEEIQAWRFLYRQKGKDNLFFEPMQSALKNKFGASIESLTLIDDNSGDNLYYENGAEVHFALEALNPRPVAFICGVVATGNTLASIRRALDGHGIKAPLFVLSVVENLEVKKTLDDRIVIRSLISM
jgi:hypothetical protein